MQLQPLEYQAELLSPQNARLWKLDDLNTSCSVYLLDATYKTPIEKSFAPRGNRYQINFFHSDVIDQTAFKLIAVRYVVNGRKTILSAAPASYFHNPGSRNNEQIWIDKFKKIDDPQLFLSNHIEHQKLFHLNRISNSPPFVKLVAHAKKLHNEGLQGDSHAKSKHLAIQVLLNAFNKADLQTVYDILAQKTHPTYEAMVQPRPNNWLCFNFTARSYKQTRTYSLLTELTNCLFIELLSDNSFRHLSFVTEPGVNPHEPINS